jgi:tetratricopeptide (TPR) repeat protein
MEIGKIEEAKKDFIKAIDFGLNIFKVHGNLASLDTPEEAIKEYAKQIELEPKNFLLYGNRGAILYNLKKFEDAIKDFDKAIELNPSDSTFYRRRALAKEELNRIDDANKDWETASKLDIPSKKKFSESEVGILNTDVSIYYFSRKDGNNYSDVERIKLKENGFIDGDAPPDFFDQFGKDMDRLMT